MRIGRAIMGLLAVTGLVTAPLALPAPGPCPGDVNGDLESNILDIQIVAAALLNGQAAEGRADVNGDGQVDIRDFQELVDRSSGTTSPSQTPAPDRTQGVVNHPNTGTPLLRAAHAPQEALDSWKGRRAGSTTFEFQVRRTHSPRTERYLFGLSPHSPPTNA